MKRERQRSVETSERDAARGTAMRKRQETFPDDPGWKERAEQAERDAARNKRISEQYGGWLEENSG